MEKVRAITVKILIDNGFQVERAALRIPFLGTEETVCRKSLNEITTKLLAMHVVAAVTNGFDNAVGIKWAKQNECWDILASQEKEYLQLYNNAIPPENVQIESMWMLAWVMGGIENFDPFSACLDSFVEIFPDLLRLERAEGFRNKARFAKTDEIILQLDLHYCIHWLITHNEFESKKTSGLDFDMFVDRRHALEWLFSDETWNDVSLDT